MWISATRLRVRSLRGLLRFRRLNAAAHRQARTAPGLREVRFRYRWPLTFCTLTLWDSEAAMHDYRNSAAHLDAMRQVKEVGDGDVVGWEAEELPGWEEAEGRLGGCRNQTGSSECA
ncbi:MAG: hypothetical protein SF028_15095 [Candidatus Sumerlaeia bacterium]|nr:hypothetical protein [Candidatus Sumerlaeia bacterium]